MNDKKKRIELACSEIKQVLLDLEKEHKEISLRHAHERGMDRGAVEHKQATQRGMAEIVSIREKYKLSLDDFRGITVDELLSDATY